MDSDGVRERAPRPRVDEGQRKIRVLGFAGMVFVIGLQLPVFIAAFGHGIDFSPGRTGLLTTWASLVIVFDVAVMAWWSCRRSISPIHAALPAVLTLLFALCAALPLALLLRVLWSKVTHQF